jgi:hypothetical protein
VTGLPELQDAVRQLPGVAAATIRWPDPHGPASLRVEFHPEADADAVGEAVLQAVADIGHADLSTLQVETAGVRTGAPRPVFTTLVLDRIGADLTVEVGLAVGAIDLTGTAHGVVHVVDDELQVVARATLQALRSFDAVSGAQVHDIARATLGSTEVIQALVELPDRTRGPLIGTALVAHDAREAAVRAVLDALNRQLELAAQIDLTDDRPTSQDDARPPV